MHPATNGRTKSMNVGVTAVLAVMMALASGGTTAAAQEDVFVLLNEVDESGVNGTASVTPAGDGVAVSMQLTGEDLTGNHPTHIHTGTCDNFDPNPTFPLTTVVLDEVNEQGKSETTVPDVALDELIDDDYVILVHKSPEELTVYLVCGEIDPGAVAVPTTGTGASRVGAVGSVTVTLVLGGLAALCALASAGSLLAGIRRPRG